MRLLLSCLFPVVAAYAATAGEAALQPGTLPALWRTGGPYCEVLPDWEVHEYNEDFYILRESGCVHYEKPFLYLIFGRDEALLEDTGAGMVQTAPLIMDLIDRWAKHKNRMPVRLIVVHSHGHGDHTAGDAQFQAMSNIDFVAATPGAVSKAAAISSWPTEFGQIDLGGRVVDVVPIPGHHEASIALYDRLTGILLTGDSLYPGRLYAAEAEVAAYAASAQRLADFVAVHPVAHVLGTHIEQTRTPYLDYPRGTAYQPEEHGLDLSRAHVLELNDAFQRMKAKPQTVSLPDFSIVVRVPTPAPRRTN